MHWGNASASSPTPTASDCPTWLPSHPGPRLGGRDRPGCRLALRGCRLNLAHPQPRSLKLPVCPPLSPPTRPAPHTELTQHAGNLPSFPALASSFCVPFFSTPGPTQRPLPAGTAPSQSPEPNPNPNPLPQAPQPIRRCSASPLSKSLPGLLPLARALGAWPPPARPGPGHRAAVSRWAKRCCCPVSPGPSSEASLSTSLPRPFAPGRIL